MSTNSHDYSNTKPDRSSIRNHGSNYWQVQITRLREFTLPVSYGTFSGGNEEFEQTIGVRLDEVNVIEWDVKRFPPDGYALGANDHHYEKIDGRYINFERRVHLHYEAAGKLVGTIAEHAEDVRGDEIKDYGERIGYTAERGHE